MNRLEFFNWIQGFTQGVHHYNITPEKWDHLKQVISQVDVNENQYIIDDQLWTTDHT